MAEETAPDGVRRAGLWLGPALAVVMLAMPHPAGLTPVGWAVAAVAVLMAVWWMTEAIPIAATALLPVALLPILGVASVQAACRPYADPLVLMFLGGFILAKAIERWSLHERLAASLCGFVGNAPARQLAGLMAATAFLSMWVSNTASAMVMLPVGQAMAVSMMRQRAHASDSEKSDASAAMMLAIAYAATIGGMATLIGTPPNALFAAYMQSAHGVSIGFAQWMSVGLPTALVLLGVAWLVLTRFAFRLPTTPLTPGAAMADATPTGAAPLSREQLSVLVVLAATALAWTGSPLLKHLLPGLPITDAGIAVTAAIVLFALPRRGGGGQALLEWKDVATLKWDVLILVGGGLSLADAISASGLGQWIGDGLGGLRHIAFPLLVLLVMFVIVFLGELASNTAVAAIFLPVAGAIAVGIGEAPIALALPVVLAASLGFMLPVATPPNAIVYSSGLVSSGRMLRTGAILDVVATLVVAAVAMTIGRWMLG